MPQAMKWLTIKLPLSCQICPVIDRHNFIKRCFSPDIVVSKLSKNAYKYNGIVYLVCIDSHSRKMYIL